RAIAERELLHQIERAHRHEPVPVVDQRSQLGDPRGVRAHLGQRARGLRLRSAVAAGQPRSKRTRHPRNYTIPSMADVVYVSRIHIERLEGPLRKARLPGESQPLVFGVHDEIAVHYKVDPAAVEPHAATIDYVVAATAG